MGLAASQTGGCCFLDLAVLHLVEQKLLHPQVLHQADSRTAAPVGVALR